MDTHKNVKVQTKLYHAILIGIVPAFLAGMLIYFTDIAFGLTSVWVNKNK